MSEYDVDEEGFMSPSRKQAKLAQIEINNNSNGSRNFFRGPSQFKTKYLTQRSSFKPNIS